MDTFPGLGTLVNVCTVLIGSGVGVLIGHRVPQRTRDVVTDALGLVTLLLAALSAAAVLDPALVDAVGSSAPVLIVLGAVLIGGIIGSLLRIEDGMERLGVRLQQALSRGAESVDRRRFVEGFVSASLVFCVGPLTVLGSINDGVGNGPDQLLVKSALDGFASVAFAASLGWGVAASALVVLVVQGTLTVGGLLLGEILVAAPLAALTATGGLLLAGVGLRLLRLKAVPVGDLLPALIVAPLLTGLVAALR